MDLLRRTAGWTKWPTYEAELLDAGWHEINSPLEIPDDMLYLRVRLLCLKDRCDVSIAHAHRNSRIMARNHSPTFCLDGNMYRHGRCWMSQPMTSSFPVRPSSETSGSLTSASTWNSRRQTTVSSVLLKAARRSHFVARRNRCISAQQRRRNRSNLRWRMVIEHFSRPLCAISGVARKGDPEFAHRR